MCSTTSEKETLSAWLEGNRIKSTELLDSLEQLGATEISDLKDLSKEDILSFQPPFLKKLEFVRFERGIESLKKSSNDPRRSIHVITDSSSSVGASIPTTVSVPPSQSNNDYQSPPLPDVCPSDGCMGVLSSHLGSRKNKYLTALSGPDFRWIVTCNTCSKKWHACHFLCGHLQKISLLGSSDIIRHEQGRFNRWQKKIKPPCIKNPQGGFLKATYVEQKKHSNENNELQSESSMSENISISTTPSLINPNNAQFDNEFKSMLGSLDEGTLNFNGFEGTEKVNTEFLLESNNINGIGDMPNSTRDVGGIDEPLQPIQKRARVTDIHPTSDEFVDEAIMSLCHEIQGRCLLKKVKNLYINKMKK